MVAMPCPFPSGIAQVTNEVLGGFLSAEIYVVCTH